LATNATEDALRKIAACIGDSAPPAPLVRTQMTEALS